MRLLLLSCVLAFASASCPCTWNVDLSTLDCSGKGLGLVPTGCFVEYPETKKIVLNGNGISKLEAGDFRNATLLEDISLSDNPLSSIHPDTFAPLANLRYITILSDSLRVIQPRLFWHNPLLTGVYLGRAFKSLPKELFSPNITNVMVLDFSSATQLSVTPCKMIEHVHPESYINASISTFWAQSAAESQNCQGRANIISQCFIVPGDFTGCEDLVEISPVVTSLALAEAAFAWYLDIPSYVTFPVIFESLLGTLPNYQSCLPNGIDKIWDYEIYYRNTDHVRLDTLYFDLADLQYFTSSSTRSVTIKADTVVLSRDIPAISYTLKIAAREIILRYPIKSFTNKKSHNPDTDKNYYTATHTMKTINGLIVEIFKHANIEITVLDSPVEPCSMPSEVDNILSVSSLVQLDLTVQCAKNILKGDSPSIEKALKMAKWAEQMSSTNPAGGMQQIRSRATSVVSSAMSLLSNDSNPAPLPVPYLSLEVYSNMVDDLSQNIQYFKDTMDVLQNKLERQAVAMFDMSMSFAERHADLEFIYQNSKTALNQAQNVYGSHLNHLNNLYTYADTAYGLIFDVYNMFNNAVSQYDTAIEKFSEGLEEAKENGFLRGCKNFFVSVGKCFTGQGGLSDIANSVYEAGDYKDEIKDMQDELIKSMDLVYDLMENVNSIMQGLQALDPDGTGDIDWATAFQDTTALVNAAGSQFVTRDQWDISMRGALILLDDEDMEGVEGANEYKVASLQLAEWGKRLGDKVISFSVLILQIKDEEESIKVDELAVEQASSKTDEIGDMMSVEETNEGNYLDILKAQNQVLMNLMLDYYSRIRADMLIMAGVIDEFCSAHTYTFFIECSPETRPTAEDDYGEILLKLGKLQIGALDSIGSLNPPPQPFTKSYEIKESLFPLCTGFMKDCPVTSLRIKGTTSFYLNDWWGTELNSVDRVRIDSIQFFLVGAITPPDTSIVIEVSHPSVFNDTFKGDVYTFTGHATECIIMYRQEEGSESIDDATYLTDCSTHHSYQNYYSRSTPGGLYTLTVISPETDISNVKSIQVRVEGSWMPHS